MLRANSTHFAAALLALALGPASVFAQTPYAVGVVTTLAGQATVARIGLAEPASMRFRDPVFTRDRISTGEKSIVRVLLGGKAVVTARELSVLTINEEPLRSTVVLDAGKVGASVLKDRMKLGETIEFRTPNAVAVVRGTVLVVEVTEGPVPANGGPAPITTTVSVIRGAVDVFALKGGVVTPVRVGGQESVRVTDDRMGRLRALTPQESLGLTADLEVAPNQQHQTRAVPQDLQRAIGAHEQAKAAALVDALAPESVKNDKVKNDKLKKDKKVGAVLADGSTITRDTVSGVTGSLDGVVDMSQGVIGSVDQVLLDASGPVLGLTGKVVGRVGGVVASTGKGNGGSSGGGAVTAATGGVGSAVSGLGAAASGLSGGGSSGSGHSGSGFSGSGISGGGISVSGISGSGISGSGISGSGISGSGISGSGISGSGISGAVGGLLGGVLSGSGSSGSGSSGKGSSGSGRH